MKKDRHKTYVLLGFGLAVLIALGAFAYVWAAQAGFGFTIAGLRSFTQARLADQQFPSSIDVKYAGLKTPVRCCCQSVSVKKTGLGETTVVAPVKIDFLRVADVVYRSDVDVIAGGSINKELAQLFDKCRFGTSTYSDECVCRTYCEEIRNPKTYTNTKVTYHSVGEACPRVLQRTERYY